MPRTQPPRERGPAVTSAAAPACQGDPLEVLALSSVGNAVLTHWLTEDDPSRDGGVCPVQRCGTDGSRTLRFGCQLRLDALRRQPSLTAPVTAVLPWPLSMRSASSLRSTPAVRAWSMAWARIVLTSKGTISAAAAAHALFRIVSTCTTRTAAASICHTSASTQLAGCVKILRRAPRPSSAFYDNDSGRARCHVSCPCESMRERPR